MSASVVDSGGREFGPHDLPMLWHPMLYHYGRNWRVPDDDEYTLRVHIDPRDSCATTR